MASIDTWNILISVQARVAEFSMRARPFSRRLKYRVDLHGVSVFGPGDAHSLIRWEWITTFKLEAGVVVTGNNTQVKFPPGVFGLTPETLLGLLEQARSIQERGSVIGRLSQPG